MSLDRTLAPPVYDLSQTAVTQEQRPGSESGSVPSPGPSVGELVSLAMSSSAPPLPAAAPAQQRICRAAERAMARTERTESGCLLWQGAFNSAGTAIIGVGQQAMAATRVVWFHRHGAFPDTKLQRSCGDNRCINVDHLRPLISWQDEAKFWERVDAHGPLHPHDATLGRCWDWLGSKLPKGYGRVRSRAAGGYAHRQSFIFANGRPPAPGLFVLHSCDRPQCVNPAHLREGTPAENVAERDERFYGRKKA